MLSAAQNGDRALAKLTNKKDPSVRVTERKELSFTGHYSNNSTASLGWLAALYTAVIE